eukprot:253282_1
MSNLKNGSSVLKFGRYEGVWKSNVSDAEFELVIDQDNFERFHTEKHGEFAFDGFFEWRIIAGKLYEEAHGRQAMEKVRGLFFNFESGTDNDGKDQYHLICLGYELVEHGDIRFLGHDGYDIVLDPSKTKIETNTLGHRLKWDNPMVLYRTACKTELIQLLYQNQYLKEQGIVDIICQYLHYFETPTKVVKNAYSFNMKVNAMDKRIHPLFKDLNYCQIKDT